MSFIKMPSLCNGLTLRHEEILPEAAVVRRIETTRNRMQELEVDTLLIYKDGAVSGPVCYLTHYPSYRLGRRAVAVLNQEAGPFLFTADPSRNVPRVRRFTACDLEGSRKFFAAGCRQAKKLAGGGVVGVVGAERLSSELAEEMEKELAGVRLKAVSEHFYALLAKKDDSSLKAVKIAHDMARQGMEILREQLDSGRDLWKSAAYIDYRLRLLGCEDTNILLNCSSKGRLRPAYPSDTVPPAGAPVAAYIAVRYARQWGAVGDTLSKGSGSDALAETINRLQEVQNGIAAEIRGDMNLEDAQAAIRAQGRAGDLVFADDLALAAGIGFDLSEYPTQAEDRLAANTVLQVSLAADDAGQNWSAFKVGMLHVHEQGCSWLPH